ncbi:MAG: hypothetical protein IKD22_06915, partial [Lentisphaeria bacterium]|nr:hypothetical protein [Lentisphaeria bacterium]
MAMYKTIFVSEEYESSSENIVGINGEVLMFGENAFASVEQALGSGVENAIVIKVQSGKYDGFTVVTDGAANTDVTVVAVDFDGGEVMVGGENLTVADSGIAAADQATILADLNDINAGNGKVFVAASEATADMPTIYVGMGEAGYVAGASATVITAQDTAGAAEILNTMYSTTVEAAATSGAVSISKDYTSADEGWGSTKFANWSSAYSNTTGSATITVEANSGNAGYIGDSNNSNKVGRNVIVESGSSLYVQRRLLKIDKTLTFKAGASFVDNHVSSVPNPYTHIDGGKLYVGEANSTVRATMNFKDNSIATLYSAIFEANNADILLGDFASVGRTSFTDSDITVNGSLSFGAHQSQSSLNGNSTMTNSTMTVKGHDMRNDTTYFANDFNRIAALVMDKSTITINDGADGTAAAAVQLGYKGSWVKKSLTLKNNSNIIVESGTAVTALWDVTLENSTIKAGALTIQDGSFKLTGTANMDLTSLTIADGKTLTMDSSSTLTLDSLSATGKIVVNMVEGFDGKKMFDFSNAGISSLPANIEINGGYAEIVDGDIYVYAGAKAEVDLTGETNKVDLSANGAKLTDAVGSSDKDIEISTGDDNSKPAVTETAKLNADITGKDVTIDNSKKLEVTGSINAEGIADITNSGENIYDKDGKLVAEATLNGGYDDEGKELAAQISAANNIVLQNDGHANVDLDANTIIIANNSKNTLIGNIGTADTENVIIADGTATADGVLVDGNGVIDGAIKDATITAQHIQIAGQAVSDSTFNGRTAIAADSSLDNTKVNGVVSVGFDAENAADTTLTLAGDTDIATLYVGKEGRANEYKAVITGNDTDVSLGQLYNRLGSTLEITDGAHLAVSNYWQSKGDVVIDDASA